MEISNVLVILSTYNGAKYIEEQIDSVFSQEGVNLHLLVRDDGSNDNTIELLRILKEKYINLEIIEGENYGCAKSFMTLMSNAFKNYREYDYYAFCDQDDIWKSNKLIEAINILSKSTETKPSLYLGSYQMVDAERREIYTPLQKLSINLPAAIISNVATGCTMVFNRSLLGKVISKTPENIIMHDYWVYLVCLCLDGFVYYDSTPYIFYRQHGHNVIGGIGDSFIKRWITRIKKLFLVGDHYKSKLATNLLSCYGNQMSDKNRTFLTDVSTCKKWSSKYHLLKNPDFRGTSIDKNLQTLGLVFTGKF